MMSILSYLISKNYLRNPRNSALRNKFCGRLSILYFELLEYLLQFFQHSLPIAAPNRQRFPTDFDLHCAISFNFIFGN